MTKILIFFLLTICSLNTSVFSQETEKTKPMTDTEIVRTVSEIDIEGKTYENVIVNIKATSPDYFLTNKFKVKIRIEDTSGKKVWSKTFKNAFLYVFSTGQIQVGKPNFDQLIIWKSYYSNDWIGKIREKEGIY